MKKILSTDTGIKLGVGIASVLAVGLLFNYAAKWPLIEQARDGYRLI
jgi:hypothetical protein